MLDWLTNLKDDAEFYYDSEAADRPIRFIERYLKLSGDFKGQPFNLLPWQQTVIRTLFGWLRHDSGKRRFRELYLISAKGAGKTPMLSAIGLYMMAADGADSPHVISMAASFEQASYTWLAAKDFIDNSSDLKQHLENKQHEIRFRHKKRKGRWTRISGKPNGRSGSAPICVIADEAHEWKRDTAETFTMVTKNLFKRSNSLLVIATNAGKDRSCFAWTMHERAMRVLDGTSSDKSLLPVIFEAPQHLDWRSETAAKAANPSLGTFILFKQLEAELTRAKEDSSKEADYRRLYLSQWVTGSDKWLDMNLYRACERSFTPAELDKAELYVGLDASLGDDLCAMVYVYAINGTFMVDSEFILPQATAEKYQQYDSIPYSDWAEAGAIKLIEEPTISIAVSNRIAESIIARHQSHKIKAVCYDAAHASGIIAALEAKQITCVAIRQGYSLFPGCEELARRLKERSIVIAPNPVMRFCAENTEVKIDERGNYWPVKPNAKGKYAGRRSAKIDGVTALVTALVEARKSNFAKTTVSVSGWLI